MASIRMEGLVKRYRRRDRGALDRPRDPRPGVRGLRRPVGLRQVDPAARDRRAGADRRRPALHRRHPGQRRHALEPRHRDGVPGLRALPAHDRLRQHGVRARDAGHPQGRDRAPGAARRRHAADRAVPAAQAQGALRRPAPARRDGPGDGAQPEGVPVRRAAVQPRRQVARRGPDRDQGAVAAVERPPWSSSPTTRSRR